MLQAQSVAQLMKKRITAVVGIGSHNRKIQEQLPATNFGSGRHTHHRFLRSSKFNFRIVENINIRLYRRNSLSEIQIDDGIKHRHNRSKIGLIIR